MWTEALSTIYIYYLGCLLWLDGVGIDIFFVCVCFIGMARKEDQLNQSQKLLAIRYVD